MKLRCRLIGKSHRLFRGRFYITAIGDPYIVRCAWCNEGVVFQNQGAAACQMPCTGGGCPP